MVRALLALIKGSSTSPRLNLGILGFDWEKPSCREGLGVFGKFWGEEGEVLRVLGCREDYQGSEKELRVLGWISGYWGGIPGALG